MTDRYNNGTPEQSTDDIVVKWKSLEPEYQPSRLLILNLKE